MGSKIDNLDWMETYSTDEITCPWCKAPFSDSWEISSNSEDEEVCGECGGVFSWERDVIVKYNSTKVEGRGPKQGDTVDGDEDESGAP